MKNNPIRGFSSLIGETIKKINATGINCVGVECESGKYVVIAADEFHYGVPVVTASNITKDDVSNFKF